MESKNTGIASIDAYIATFPEETQKKLKELRAAIRAAAPEAKEKISYQMPAFTLEGNLVYFSAYKSHIGFYGASGAIQAFKHEVSTYLAAKSTLRFPLDKPLPLQLIRKIVKFRVAENLEKAKIKAGKSK